MMGTEIFQFGPIRAEKTRFEVTYPTSKNHHLSHFLYTNAEKKHGRFCFWVLKAPRGTQICPTDKSWVSFEKFR